MKKRDLDKIIDEAFERQQVAEVKLTPAFLREMIEEVVEDEAPLAKMIREGAETIGADINEIWFAYLAAGGNWNNLGDGTLAQKTLDERVAALQSATKSPQEAQEYIDIQKGRAKKSLEEVKKWGSSNKYSGKIVKAYWTAREGTLQRVVNEDNEGDKIPVKQGGSGGNPTDVALRFSDGKLLGVSLKSTGGSGNITFKNGGFGSTVKRLEALGVATDYTKGVKLWGKADWKEVVRQARVEAGSDLPMALTEAPAKLRAQPQTVRKMYAQALQYFAEPESERMEFLLRKYRNQAVAQKKQQELEEWGRYLEAIIPTDQLGGKTFQEFARDRYQELKDRGNEMLGKARDIMLHSMNQLDRDQRKAFILTEYINASAQTPYWVKATGMGTKEPYTAKIEDPINNPMYLALNTEEITFEPVASGTIGVRAGGAKIMKIRAKWESTPLTTSIKTDATKW